MLSIEAIIQAIESAGRIANHVQLLHGKTSGLAPTETPADAANDLVKSFGFQEINPRSWSVLDKSTASSVAQRLLSEDLAYKSELLSEKTANYYARQLVETLSPNEASFLCNAEFIGSSVQWDPIGTATFEVALLGFDKELSFLLYAHAED